MAEFLTSPKIQNIKHGFFSRNGGVSKGVYSSLNVGLGSNDVQGDILQNRQIVCDEIVADRLFTLYQIHSNKVVFVDENTVTNKTDNTIKADAIVTKTPALAIGILTADCVPILFSDPVNHVIGAAHAGWKGALTGIVQNTVDEMVKQGAERQNIIAVIGACIAQESYEVGVEFYNNFIDNELSSTEFFIQSSDKYLFDIGGYVAGKLQQENIKEIDNLNIDTYKGEDNFYSYRRATHKKELDYGRQISVICL